MKNKFYIILFMFLSQSLLAENIQIQSKNITLDKNKEITIFEKQVLVKTEDNYEITAEFAEYDKKKGLIKLKKDIKAKDGKNNIIESNNAEYYEKTKTLKSFGNTKIITSESYIVESQDITFDNKNSLIFSNKKTIIIDLENNKISLDNFEYSTINNIFKSIGEIKIEDNKNNDYEFSQIYIDTKKKEILGSDIKAYLNDEDFKIHSDNKPRVFANTLKIDDQKTAFDKSIFTFCDYRENDKCPPWTIQSSKMVHDNKKKTIYYDNAVIKVYDIPIFYLPKLSHPDPSVERRSGFLPPSFSDSKNLGFGFSVPYFLAIDKDKNFTFETKLYVDENPLFLGEYHQAFKNSYFYADFGYTEGYKKNTLKKKAGEKSHFFSKFVKSFKGRNNSENILSFSVQDTSNDKYLKLYKIKSNLVDYNKDTLESSFNFTHENDQIFLGVNANIYETLKEDYNDKYEFILPEITLDKNLFSDNNLGSLNLQSNLKIHNFDTNKFTNFFVNDFNWEKDLNFQSGLTGRLLSNIKNINYEARNVDLYKKSYTNELYGALGYLSQIELVKNINNSYQTLIPKVFFRYAPGEMRKEDNSGNRLDPKNVFSINRLNNINNFETGLSAAFGVDYKFKTDQKQLDFSLGQIINDKENKNMASETSLDEKLSDVVGSMNYKHNDKFDFNYNFAIDQNLNDLNYNEFGTSINLDPLKISFNYLHEDKHIGDQEYLQTKIDLLKNDDGKLSFQTKRNLVTDSAEYYDLSYEYINDCLRAGVIYRREFYNDSEIEQENSLMFKITLTPFGNINSPSISN